MALKPGQWIHMVGIAGAGMSGIAKLLTERGFIVSGSDLQNNDATKKLEALGVTVYKGHSPDNLKDGIDKVVISSAVAWDNEEVQAAADKKIEVIKRGEMLAEIIKEDKVIAVAGAHGKTTTTAMIYTILENCGADPTLVVGGEIKDSEINAKNGLGHYSVVEADESDASFLALKPYIAVVTNIENDHLDYYKTEKNIENAFAQYLQGVQTDGTAILFGDEPVINEVKKNCRAKTVLYGENNTGDYFIKNWMPFRLGSNFDVYRTQKEIPASADRETNAGIEALGAEADFSLNELNFPADVSEDMRKKARPDAAQCFRSRREENSGKRLGHIELSVPGRHNAVNALAAVITGLEIGLSFEDIAGAIKKYTGAKRRFQITGETNGIVIVDDYAHHPTEIRATIQAARHFHSGRLIVVFQPHRYTRTRDLGQELGASLRQADLTIVTDIYAAGEKSIPEISGRIIADAAGCECHKSIYLDNMDEILDYLLSILNKNDLLITMGAGDIWKLGEELLDKLNRLSK
ncbi:MAG: UDP-N-acetylmuramate--L-alanine ligase [Syntrophomonadaceae bacterium]|jgi:UDP-N-acetylmuramate--alanine ligase|nr:UDP-N-acetylmuramate--L-alanine ligase [Syntrophomonadaceae bacterium]